MSVHTEDQKVPIALEEVWERGVEGRFGHKFGTIFQIEGVAIENTSNWKVDADEPCFLEVDTVNGHKIDHPIKIRYRKHHSHSAVTEPVIGNRFKYMGYETGFYAGWVNDQYLYTWEYADTGYHFHVQFLVLADKKRNIERDEYSP